MYQKRDYAANYFLKTEKIIKQFNPNAIVTLQFFQRYDDTLLGGINEVLALLQTETDTTKYSIKYLPEGSIINSCEVVLELEGHYQHFGVFEGMIDGILARATSIATNAYHCLKAAKQKTVIFMGDRSDHYINQERDGLAVELAGIKMHSTNAGAQGNDQIVFGSIPHILIQNFEGDLLTVMQHYHQLFPEDQDLIALVDFNNDVISDSLKVLNYFGTKLKGVRVDTSKTIQDKMFNQNDHEYGVTPNQIKKLRQALDANNGKHVKIIVSSGFNPEKIAYFEQQQTPVDAYGVGEYIMQIRNYFSADATKINGKELAKVGRKYQFNPKLQKFQK
ncbi:Nicotinate phosphoribosyltransferase [[Mycoplasma] cavipharyngis]|uniref:nicotinate phosphoribosyltransferase n=1 Tax=[Mycoplasma] cavipharyngis TaxID=92757 RepID=UPI0037047001